MKREVISDGNPMNLKINNFMRTCRRWLSNNVGRKKNHQPIEPELPTSGSDIPDMPVCVKRIGQTLRKLGIRRRKGQCPGIWHIESESFTDAYRLLLRLGNQDGLVCLRNGGHVHYRLNLPDNNGHIILSEHVGNRRDTLAVMLFHIVKMPEIKELRFLNSPDKAQ